MVFNYGTTQPRGNALTRLKIMINDPVRPYHSSDVDHQDGASTLEAQPDCCVNPVSHSRTRDFYFFRRSNAIFVYDDGPMGNSGYSSWCINARFAKRFTVSL